MSTYPNDYDEFIRKIDGIDTINAEDMNTIQDSVSRIERVMGINPQDSSITSTSTISQRLDGIEESLTSESINELRARLNAHLNIAYETNGVNTTKQVSVVTSNTIPPLSVSSNKLVDNLNSKYWDDHSWDDLIDFIDFHNQPDFESEWFYIQAGNYYTINHSLGVEPKLYFILMSDKQNPANVSTNDYYTNMYAGVDGARSVAIKSITSNSLNISFPAGGWYSPIADAKKTRGSCKILVWKTSPWRGFKPDYDSDWFQVTNNTIYTKTHSMDTAPKLFQVLYSEETNPSLAENDYYVIPCSFSSAGTSQGLSIHTINSSTMKVQTYNSWPGRGGLPITDGCIRVFAWRGDSTPLYGATSSNMTIYVDDNYTGSNSDGSASKPYTSIAEAFSEIPRIIAHSVTIYIVGTYSNPSGISILDDGNSAMIRIPNFAFVKDGKLTISGSTSTPSDTKINCFSDPNDFSSSPLTNYGIYVDNTSGKIYIKNLSILGTEYNSVKTYKCNNINIDNIVIDTPGNPGSISDDYSNIYIDTSVAYINNITSQNSYGSGLHTNSSTIYVNSATCTSNATNGCLLQRSDGTIIDSTINTNTSRGIMLNYSGYFKITTTDVSSNSGNGAYVEGSKLFLDRCTISNNGDNGVYGTFNSSLEIYKCTSSSDNGDFGVFMTLGTICQVVYNAALDNFPRGASPGYGNKLDVGGNKHGFQDGLKLAYIEEYTI